MADVVFILGAGCSAHAGAPLMAGFLDKARDLLDAGAVEDKREQFQRTFEMLGRLQSVHSKAQLDIENIESVFSAVDMARTFRKLPGVRPEDIEGALDALQWVIVRTLEESFAFQIRDHSLGATGEYLGFAQLIRQILSDIPPRSVAVITFNYDLGVEFALADEGLEFTYSLPGEPRGGVPLLKLHGSLNWHRSNNTERTIGAWALADLRRTIPAYTRPDEVPSGVTIQVARLMKRALGDRIQDLPAIVPPTWSKGEHQRELAPVWERAAAELGTARDIIIAGYSLAPTDQFFRLLFALGTEGANPLRALHVVNTDQAVFKRFEEMLGLGAIQRLRKWPLGFHQALAQMINNQYRPRQR